MRAYYFGNMYLSSIQQGIQAAHATADMFVKYSRECNEMADNQEEILYEWSSNHKTMILLNGGYSETIRELLWFMEDKQNPYPFAPFYEGKDALDGALTTVAIVLPEKIYVAASLARPFRSKTLDNILEDGCLNVAGVDNSSGKEVVWEYNKWEYNLVKKLNDFGLAS